MKSVYCAVRTGFLNKAVYASSVKGYITVSKELSSSLSLFSIVVLKYQIDTLLKHVYGWSQAAILF
jgi:hypothetical protein